MSVAIDCWPAGNPERDGAVPAELDFSEQGYCLRGSWRRASRSRSWRSRYEGGGAGSGAQYGRRRVQARTARIGRSGLERSHRRVRRDDGTSRREAGRRFRRFGERGACNRSAGTRLGSPRRYRIGGSWPNSRLVLVPAPLTTTSNSLVHLRTNTLSGARDLHERGGTLYLSCCAETAIPELRKLAGVEITDRAPVGSSVVGFNMIADFGALSPGDRIAFTGVSPEPNHRGVLIDTDGAEVLAVDDAGNAVLTRARFGEGQTILSTYPVELLLATQPDAHGVRDQSWKLYAALAQNADALAPARVDHPDVGSHLLTGPTGGILIAVNHCPVKVSAPLVLPPRCSDLRLEVADTSEAELSTNGLSRSPPTLSASLPGGGRQANASV